MTSRSSTRKPRKLLTPTQLHILMALADGKRHGYAIKQEVERRTDGALNLGPATLYDAIQRLVGAVWIAEVEADTDEATPGSPRRYYRITRAGRVEMKQELDRLAAIVDQARSVGMLSRARRA